MPVSKGTAEWRGNLKEGSGSFTAGESLTADYSFRSRFEDGAPGANPEQLIAAAHAACFTMALSNMLSEAGHVPDVIRTEAQVTMRPIDGSQTISTIKLVTRGQVPGLDEAGFVEIAAKAKVSCPVSRALASVPEILLDAALAN